MEDPELIGKKIADKYVIESYLGGGGMGAVYRARQAGLDKVVAVKVLHPEFNFEASFVERFKREAKAASRIDHPNSMRVIDFGQEPDGLLYIVMEYLDGLSLFEILRKDAPLPPARIIDLFRQALAALAAAHDLGIVHRDLKPDNIVVLRTLDDEGVASERVKVCDFGIAKFTGGNQATSIIEKLTTDGTIIGTPDYLSPEQARSEAIDARSDVYSMGVILFEALTGTTPFKSDSPLGLVLQHLDTEPPLPSSIVPDVDPRLEAICLRCLKKKPEERFATARELRAALALDSIRAPGLAPKALDKLLPQATRSTGLDAGVRTLQSLEPSKEGRSPSIALASASPQVTPPPVSSTPAPLPLLLTKKSQRDPRKQSRLTDVGAIPEPSVVPGVIFAVLIVGATVAAATWLYKGSAFRGASSNDSRSAATSATPPAAPSSTTSDAAARPPLVASTLLDAGLSFSAVTLRAAPKGKKRASAKVDSTTGSRVIVGQVVAFGVEPEAVANALPGPAFADCYRDALGYGAVSGTGKLHLEFENGLTKGSFGGDPAVVRLDKCLESSVVDVVLGQPMSPHASADVDLVFVAK